MQGNLVVVLCSRLSDPGVNPTGVTYDVHLATPEDRSGVLRHGVSLVGKQRQSKPAGLIIA